VVTEEKSQLLINFSPSNLVYILIRPISTSPESLMLIGEKIFLAILSGAPPNTTLLNNNFATSISAVGVATSPG
jgi:hypothetical protein